MKNVKIKLFIVKNAQEESLKIDFFISKQKF